MRLYRNAKLFHRTGKSDDAFRKRTAPQSAKMPRRAQDAHSGAKRDSSGAGSAIQQGQHTALRAGTDRLIDEPTILEDQQRRDAHDAELGGDKVL